MIELSTLEVYLQPVLKNSIPVTTIQNNTVRVTESPVLSTVICCGCYVGSKYYVYDIQLILVFLYDGTKTRVVTL